MNTYATLQHDKHRGILDMNSDQHPECEEEDLDIKTLTDDEANELYLRIMQQCTGRKSYAKKNWSEEETQLLKWAVIKYTKERKISTFKLVIWTI